MNNPDCIFCRIVTGSIPAMKLYEDENVLSFMDIGPVIKGHALVIPKKHYDPIINTPDEELSRLIKVVRLIAGAQIKGLQADGINVTQANGASAGQIVPHIHFHVIPRFSRDGHHWNWDAKKYESPEEMRSYAERILEGLNHVGNLPCATI